MPRETSLESRSGNYEISFAQQQRMRRGGGSYATSATGWPSRRVPRTGVSPRGGTHGFRGSGNYAVLMNVAPAGGQQDKWAWCSYCQQMW
jgi:hypothetical protein